MDGLPGAGEFPQGYFFSVVGIYNIRNGNLLPPKVYGRGACTRVCMWVYISAGLFDCGVIVVVLVM